MKQSNKILLALLMAGTMIVYVTACSSGDCAETIHNTNTQTAITTTNASTTTAKSDATTSLSTTTDEPTTNTKAPDTTTVPSTESIEYDYVLNINSMKFHYPNCSSAKKIKDENRSEFIGTRDEIIAQGYSPCGNCDP